MKNWKTLLLGIAMIANTSFAAPQVVDKVAAVVNNGVVLESDVDGLMQSVKLNAGQAGQQLPDDATLRHQILERLIMDQIVLQMGQKMGVKISDDQLDQAIANIAKQNNMTLDQMRSRLALAEGIKEKFPGIGIHPFQYPAGIVFQPVAAHAEGQATIVKAVFHRSDQHAVF